MRAIFTLRVCAVKGNDDVIRSLRAWLKRGLRDFGLKCVDVREANEEETDMTFNYSDADSQDDRSPIPDGLYKLKVSVKRGGHGPDRMLSLAKNQRGLMVKASYTVVVGEHAGYQIWDYVAVALDETDHPDLPPIEPDRIDGLRGWVRRGRARIKAILNSTHGLDPEDVSEAAQAKRNFASHDALNGLIFWGEIATQPARDGYDAKNILDRVVVPGDADYPRAAPATPSGSAVVPRKSWKDDLDDSIPFAPDRH
jgi:hypothetical protein